MGYLNWTDIDMSAFNFFWNFDPFFKNITMIEIVIFSCIFNFDCKYHPQRQVSRFLLWSYAIIERWLASLIVKIFDIYYIMCVFLLFLFWLEILSSLQKLLQVSSILLWSYTIIQWHMLAELCKYAFLILVGKFIFFSSKLLKVLFFNEII